MKVGVINYGVGNLGSVVRALEELRANPIIIDQPKDIHLADAIILPGVGSFTECKRLLDRDGWTINLRDHILGLKKPLLGICVGMQLLADFGMEGSIDDCGTEGLGLVPGVVSSIPKVDPGLRIPHVGWNSVSLNQPNDLFIGIPNQTDFYFVHSYAFMSKSPSDILGTVNYGTPLVAAIHKDNVWGVQFHPEKSSKAGLRVLRNFINMG